MKRVISPISQHHWRRRGEDRYWCTSTVCTIRAIGRRMGIAAEKTRPDIARNLPPRTTGSVPRIEQCVCVVGAANSAPQGGPHMSLDVELKVAKYREKRS